MRSRIRVSRDTKAVGISMFAYPVTVATTWRVCPRRMTGSPTATPSFFREEASTTTAIGASRARRTASGKSVGKDTDPGAGSTMATRA